MEIKTVRQKNNFLGLLLITIGIGIGIGITSSFSQLAGLTLLKSQSKPAAESVIDQTEMKKKALESFYKEFTEAENNEDWGKLYSTINPNDKKWLSIEDFTLMNKGVKPASIEYIVHNMSVSENTGSVDRTVITCVTTECSGEDNKEQRGVKEFVYIDNQWYQQARKEPSEKARQLTAYMYANSSAQKQKELANRYGGGINQSTRIIRTWSIVLENNPELMAYDEALVEKHKAESSRPNVYVDSPDIVQQPIVQQPTFNNRLNCTSNSVGSYTYTNCY
jgi:hypothetical protein